MGKRDRSPSGDDALLAKNKFALLANRTAPAAAVAERKEKLPPFYVRSIEGNLKADLDELIKRGLRATLKLCTDGFKILVPSKPHYNAVLEYLRQKKAQFFTHDIPAEKPFKVVLRGLYDMKEAELSAYLTECGLKVVAVHKIRRKETNTKFRDQLYLLHLEKGSVTLKELKEIKAISHVVVEWERYRPVHRDVTQCWKCLNFGHGGRNCHLTVRCSNCGENHEQEQCPTKLLVAKCCNCGGDHPSTDRACPKRAEFIQLRRNVANRKNQGRSTVALNNQANFPALQQRHVVPNLAPLPLPPTPRPRPAPRVSPPGFQTYAQAAGQLPNPPTEDSGLYSAGELFGIFKTLLDKLQHCRTKHEQVEAVCQYTLEVLYG